MNDALFDMIERSIVFRYVAGDTVEIGPHTTGWRTVPSLLIARTFPCEGSLEIAGREPMFGKDGEAGCICPGVPHRCTMTAGFGIGHWTLLDYTILGGVSL